MALAPPPPPPPPLLLVVNPIACRNPAIPDCLAAANGTPVAAAAARAAALRCLLDSEPVDEKEASELAEWLLVKPDEEAEIRAADDEDDDKEKGVSVVAVPTPPPPPPPPPTSIVEREEYEEEADVIEDPLGIIIMSIDGSWFIGDDCCKDDDDEDRARGREIEG